MKVRINQILRASAAILVLLLLAVIAAGCGGGSTTSGAGDAGGSAGGGQQSQSEKSADSGIGDACQLVTQADAAKIFGQPATKDEGVPVIDPKMTGECLWTYDADMGNQLIQFRIWNSPDYYGAPTDSQPFSIGEKGYVRVNKYAGVDIEWVQNGKTYSLSYSTTGSGVPDATTKVEEVKNLAKKVEQQV